MNGTCRVNTLASHYISRISYISDLTQFSQIRHISFKYFFLSSIIILYFRLSCNCQCYVNVTVLNLRRFKYRELDGFELRRKTGKFENVNSSKTVHRSGKSMNDENGDIFYTYLKR